MSIIIGFQSLDMLIGIRSSVNIIIIINNQYDTSDYALWPQNMHQPLSNTQIESWNPYNHYNQFGADNNYYSNGSLETLYLVICFTRSQ